MTGEIAKSQTFEQKMKTRIRESIGDMLSDEDLEKMVERSLEEVFFNERKNPNGGFHAKPLPPLLHEIVKELLEPEVQKAVVKYIKKNPKEV